MLALSSTAFLPREADFFYSLNVGVQGRAALGASPWNDLFGISSQYRVDDADHFTVANKTAIPDPELKTLGNAALIAFWSQQPNLSCLGAAGMRRLTQEFIHAVVHFIGKSEVVRKPATLPKRILATTFLCGE